MKIIIQSQSQLNRILIEILTSRQTEEFINCVVVI